MSTSIPRICFVAGMLLLAFVASCQFQRHTPQDSVAVQLCGVAKISTASPLSDKHIIEVGNALNDKQTPNNDIVLCRVADSKDTLITSLMLINTKTAHKTLVIWITDGIIQSTSDTVKQVLFTREIGRHELDIDCGVDNVVEYLKCEYIIDLYTAKFLSTKKTIDSLKELTEMLRDREDAKPYIMSLLIRIKLLSHDASTTI